MSQSIKSLKDPGFTMAYWDSTAPGDELEWLPLQKEEEGAAYWTTAQLPYITQPQEPTGFVVYNGQTCSKNPATTWNWTRYCNTQFVKDDHDRTYAHAKGFVIFNEHGGLWMIHSSPGFPLNSTFYQEAGWRWTKTTFGQDFFCMSLPPDSINSVATLMQVSYPHIQEHNIAEIPNSLREQYAAVVN